MTTSLMSNDRAVASDSASFIEVKELIRQALASAAKTNTVEVIETHISTVFLTDRFAYKLKKPVRFDFVSNPR